MDLVIEAVLIVAPLALWMVTALTGSELVPTVLGVWVWQLSPLAGLVTALVIAQLRPRWPSVGVAGLFGLVEGIASVVR